MDICPRCGKKNRGGELCKQCLEEMQVHETKEYKIKVCERCQRVFFQNAWRKFQNFRAIENRLRKGKQGHVEITSSYTLCSHCGKGRGEYFEGILQVRNAREEMLAFVRNAVRGIGEKGIHITKTEQMPYGTDFYLTSQRYAQVLGKRLQKEFGGTVEMNRKLHTRDRQTSKDVYRMTVLFEAHPFHLGDIVQVQGKLLKITKSGKHIKGEELRTGKKITIRVPKDLLVLKKQQAVVAKVKPRLEVIHPETYQSTPVENVPRKKWKMGEKVKIVLHNGKVYGV